MPAVYSCGDTTGVFSIIIYLVIMSIGNVIKSSFLLLTLLNYPHGNTFHITLIVNDVELRFVFILLLKNNISVRVKTITTWRVYQTMTLITLFT